jgi:hypothetical protein
MRISGNTRPALPLGEERGIPGGAGGALGGGW